VLCLGGRAENSKVLPFRPSRRTGRPAENAGGDDAEYKSAGRSFVPAQHSTPAGFLVQFICHYKISGQHLTLQLQLRIPAIRG
jgi:hypothetical protein